MLVTTSYRLCERPPRSARGPVTGWSTRDAPVRLEESSLATGYRRFPRCPPTQTASLLPETPRDGRVRARGGALTGFEHPRGLGLGHWWVLATCYETVVVNLHPRRVRRPGVPSIRLARHRRQTTLGDRSDATGHVVWHEQVSGGPR